MIVETKGAEDLDDQLKRKRLAQWCEDVNKAQQKVNYASIYVKQEVFSQVQPNLFIELVSRLNV